MQNKYDVIIAGAGLGWLMAAHVLDDGDIDYLFRLTVRSALYSHMEQIERERPALALTLKRFSDMSVADALQVGSC